MGRSLRAGQQWQWIQVIWKWLNRLKSHPDSNADANQLWRVFSNLIGNALKHNPHEIRLMLAANVVEPKRQGSVRESNGMENVKQLVQPLVQLQKLFVKEG